MYLYRICLKASLHQRYYFYPRLSTAMSRWTVFDADISQLVCCLHSCMGLSSNPTNYFDASLIPKYHSKGGHQHLCLRKWPSFRWLYLSYKCLLSDKLVEEGYHFLCRPSSIHRHQKYHWSRHPQQVNYRYYLHKWQGRVLSIPSHVHIWVQVLFHYMLLLTKKPCHLLIIRLADKDYRLPVIHLQNKVKRTS